MTRRHARGKMEGMNDAGIAERVAHERRRQAPPRTLRPVVGRPWRPPISLGQLRRQTGVDRSYLASIFGGKRRPGLGAARKIAAALGMTIDALLLKLGY